MADRNVDPGMKIGYTTEEGMYLRIPVSEAFKIHNFPSKIDPFAASSAQEFPLGTELFYRDRKFRYTQNGGSSLAVANLTQMTVPLAGHIDEVVSTAAIGATTISFTPNTVTTDDMTANDFADGYLYINDDTGEGYAYGIRKHPAITGGVAGVLTLYDPIVIATVTSGTTGTIVRNRWKKVIQHPAPATALLSGVSVCVVAANYYCWLQVNGPCPVLTEGTVVIGSRVIPSASVDGGVTASASNGTDADLQSPGTCVAVNANGEHSLINLDLD